MLKGSEAADTFINKLIDVKLKGTELDPEVRRTLHKNLLERLENQIIHAILSLLDEHQQLELEHLVDSKQTDKIEGYLTERGIDLNRVLAGVMTEFQASYLGV